MNIPRVEQKMEVRQETHIKASPQKVWEVMTSPEGMKRWLGPKEYEPRQSAKIVFLVNTDTHQERMSGEIVTFDPPRELAFTWTQEIIGGETWPVPTLVTLTLVPENDGTRVILVHSGFDRLPESIRQEEYAGYVQGWAVRPVLEGLKSLVEEK